MSDKERLVCVVMGQDCEKFIGMCLNSVKDADAIVYCDGGSTDGTLKYLNTHGFQSNPNGIKDIGEGDARNSTWDIIQNEYNQEDKGMNGKQRNFYLKYIKEKYPGWWCLVLDADEIVDGLNKFKDIIQTAPKDRLYSPRMRHLIGDLTHEDATYEEHFVLHRLFYINND